METEQEFLTSLIMDLENAIGNGDDFTQEALAQCNQRYSIIKESN